MKKQKICVIGLGYIGLPTAALLATSGYDVHGVDVNQQAVDIINQGLIHIVEPDLDTFVKAAVESGHLIASTKGVVADIFMICVPTPFNEHSENEIPSPDLKFVESAAIEVSKYVKAGDLVILESTSPVGTTEKIKTMIQKQGVDVEQIHFAYCPERVLPGKIMFELVHNDRIVGGVDPVSTELAQRFYQSFIKGQVLPTNAKTAEMCKLTENSFRDVNIAFANEISILCSEYGIDSWELISFANRHPRVNILQPGVGVGGHCIAVDPWFLIYSSPDSARLMHTARKVNDGKTLWILKQMKEKIAEFEKAHSRAPQIACFGLSFKPDIDDLRESPALRIFQELRVQFNNVYAVEPNIEQNKPYLVSSEKALKEADFIFLLVKHKEFIKMQFPKEKTTDYCGVNK